MMELRRATVRGFDSGTYKATVQLEGNPHYLSGVPVNRGIGSGDMVAGRWCVVVFVDPHEPGDAMVVGVY